MAATDVGAGVTVTFSSGFFAQILSVDGPTLSREAVETTHSTTSTGKTFIPSAFWDPGEITVEINFDADATPPISAVAETVTVTYPIPTGSTTGATWSASGFMTAFSPSAPIEDRMTATATIKLSGDVTYVDAA